MQGIIIIDKLDDGRCNVETQNFASLRGEPKNHFGPQSQNLASIVRGFKTGVKKFATLNPIDIAWQPRYHNHIIRDDASYQRIRNCIINNPKDWRNDKFWKARENIPAAGRVYV